MKAVTLSLRLDNTIAEELQSMAQRNGVSKTDLMIEAIQAFIESHGDDELIVRKRIVAVRKRNKPERRNQ